MHFAWLLMFAVSTHSCSMFGRVCYWRCTVPLLLKSRGVQKVTNLTKYLVTIIRTELLTAKLYRAMICLINSANAVYVFKLIWGRYTMTVLHLWRTQFVYEQSFIFVSMLLKHSLNNTSKIIHSFDSILSCLFK